MIQFARASGLEVSLATFGIIENVLLKIGGKTRKSAGDEVSRHSPLFEKERSTFVEIVVSRLFHSLPTFVEIFSSDPSAGDPLQQPCSCWQADAALGFSQTQ